MTRARHALTRSAAALALSVAAFAGPALADAQMAAIGEALGLSAEPTGTLRREAGGRLVVTDFQAAGGAYGMSAERLVLDPGQQGTAFTAEGLSVGDPAGHSGWLNATSFEGGDISVLRALLANSLMVESCEGQGISVPFRASGISLQADADMGAGAVREETRLDAVDATFLMGPGCSELTDLVVDGFAARGVGGAISQASRLTYAANPGTDSAMTFTLQGLVAVSAVGVPLVTADAIELQTSLARPIGELFLPGDDLVKMLLADARDGLLALTLQGFDSDLSLLLPGSVPPGHRLQGDLRLRMEGGEHTTLSLQSEMAGLGDILVEADLLVDPSVDAAGGPAALAMGVRVVEGQLSYRDRGLDAILQATTGQGLAGLVSEALTDVQGSLPAMASGRLAPVFESMIAWTETSVAGGGAVAIEPRDPVSLAQIAVASMQGAVGLTQTLGVSTGPAR